jgi:hypothetical protein
MRGVAVLDAIICDATINTTRRGSDGGGGRGLGERNTRGNMYEDYILII